MFKTFLKKFFLALLLGLNASLLLINQAQAAIIDLAPTDPGIRGLASQSPESLVLTLQTIAGYAISGVLAVTGSFMVVYIIYGGLLLLTSIGNEEKITKGKNTITWAIIGLIVIITSYASVSYIFSTTPSGGGSIVADNGTPPNNAPATDKCADAITADATLAEYTKCVEVTVPGDIGPPPASCINTPCDIGSSADRGNCCKATYGAPASGLNISAQDANPHVTENTGATPKIYTINLWDVRYGNIVSIDTATPRRAVDLGSIKIIGSFGFDPAASVANGVLKYTLPAKDPLVPITGNDPNTIQYEACLLSVADRTKDCITKNLTVTVDDPLTIPDPTCTSLPLSGVVSGANVPGDIIGASGVVSDPGYSMKTLTTDISLPAWVTEGTINLGKITKTTNGVTLTPCKPTTAPAGTTCPTTAAATKQINYTYTSTSGKTCTKPIDITINPATGSICLDALSNKCAEFINKPSCVPPQTKWYTVKKTTSAGTTSWAACPSTTTYCCSCGAKKDDGRHPWTPPTAPLWTSATCFIAPNTGVALKATLTAYAKKKCDASASSPCCKLKTQNSYTATRDCYNGDYCWDSHCGSSGQTLCCAACVYTNGIDCPAI